jgi:hypothetical protein
MITLMVIMPMVQETLAVAHAHTAIRASVAAPTTKANKPLPISRITASCSAEAFPALIPWYHDTPKCHRTGFWGRPYRILITAPERKQGPPPEGDGPCAQASGAKRLIN